MPSSLVCHDIQREGSLVALIDRQLTPEQVSAVMHHLEVCPTCTVQFVQLMEINGSMEIATLWATIRDLNPQIALGPDLWW